MIKAAKILGDNREESSVESCDTLMADESLPVELRCWAVRQKIKLCTYAKREWEALDTGKVWLQSHEDIDDDPLGIRAMMGQIISQRGHENFVPLYEDVQEVFEDLFANHPTDNMLVIQAHVNYARILRKLSVTNGSLRIEAAKHCYLANNALTRLQNTETSKSLIVSQERLDNLLSGIAAMQQQLLDMGTDTVMTEEEYVDKWKQKAETVRRMREERIENGEIDPTQLPRTETYAF